MPKLILFLLCLSFLALAGGNTRLGFGLGLLLALAWGGYGVWLVFRMVFPPGR